MNNNAKAIVLDMSETGYSIVKCLGHEEVPIIGVHNATWQPLANHSAYVEESIILSDNEKEIGTAVPDEETLETLIELGKRLDEKGVLIIASDNSADFCSRYKKELEPYFHVPGATKMDTHKIMHKGPMSDIAQEAGLLIPEGMTLTKDTEDIKGTILNFSMPAIVKPANSLQGYKDKMAIETDAAKLYEEVMRLFDSCSSLLISQYIRGPGHNMREVLGFLREDNEEFVGMVIQKLRQHPYLRLGSGTLETTVEEPDIVDMTSEFAKRIGMYSPLHLEFKREEGTNKPYFIEANFRCNSGVCISEGAGLNIPYLAYLSTIGQLGESPSDYEVGARWVEEHRDWKLVESGEITEEQLLDGYKNIKTCSVFDPNDPEPFRIQTERKVPSELGNRAITYLTRGE